MCDVFVKQVKSCTAIFTIALNVYSRILNEKTINKETYRAREKMQDIYMDWSSIWYNCNARTHMESIIFFTTMFSALNNAADIATWLYCRSIVSVEKCVYTIYTDKKIKTKNQSININFTWQDAARQLRILCA